MASSSQVKSFIEKLSKLAINECNKRDKKVLPSVCIAQAALETGYGTSGLMTKANAYFGIKWTKGCGYDCYTAGTWEVIEGNKITTQAGFRAYSSVADSVKDYYDLITGSSRYSKAVNNKDAKSTIKAIHEGGYATDPDYQTKVMNIINSYNLTQYDKCMTSSTTNTTKKEVVNVFYKVKTQKHGWLGEIENYDEKDNVRGYAGWKNSPITDVAIKVDKGSIKYRVHVKGGKWLGWITQYNIKDSVKGYAGNGKPIDAIQIFYYTPNNIRPYKRAKYKVNNYGWQYDTETKNNQDGYAGIFGKNITKLQISIE